MLRHATRYVMGNGLVMAASLISFPVLTRLLSTSEYGMMSTVVATVGLVVSVGKMGMQKATVRFYHEAERQDGDAGVDRLVATQVLGMAFLGALATLGWWAFVAWMPADWLNSEALKSLLLLTVGLVWLRIFESGALNLLYAQEKSGLLNVYGVVKRYVTLVLSLGALWWIASDARHFFVGTIVAEGLMLIVLVRLAARMRQVQARAFSAPLLRAMLAFGLPMVGVELAWSVLALGDRYVIQVMLGPSAVGIYAASYNLCDYAKLATMAAVATAVAPTYMRIWSEEGREATERFLARYARGYVAFGMLVATLVAVNAESLVHLLASKKYSDGTAIVPWVMVGMVLESYFAVATAGLFIRKRSGLIFALVGIAAAVNIGLNVLLIPLFDIVGAAIATLASFALLLACTLVAGRGDLRVEFPWRSAGIGLLAFLVSDHLAMSIATGSLFGDLALHTLVGAALFVAITGLLDGQIREETVRLLRVARARWRR